MTFPGRPAKWPMLRAESVDDVLADRVIGEGTGEESPDRVVRSARCRSTKEGMAWTSIDGEPA